MEDMHQFDSNLYTRYEELRIFWWYRKMLNIFIRALWWKFESELWFNSNDKIANIQRWLTDGSNFVFRNYLDATHGKIKNKMYENNEHGNKKIHCIFKILFDSGKYIVFSRDGYSNKIWVFSLDLYLNRLDDKSKKEFFDINNKLHEIEYAHFTSNEYLDAFENSEFINNLVNRLRKDLLSTLDSKRSQPE